MHNEGCDIIYEAYRRIVKDAMKNQEDLRDPELYAEAEVKFAQGVEIIKASQQRDTRGVSKG
jgi:hypothetical protein